MPHTNNYFFINKYLRLVSIIKEICFKHLFLEKIIILRTKEDVGIFTKFIFIVTCILQYQ